MALRCWIVCLWLNKIKLNSNETQAISFISNAFADIARKGNGMNELAEFAVKLLKEYADEKHTTVRGTSDLSPLEEWLIIKLYNKEDE